MSVSQGTRTILMHGLAMILVGLLLGLVVPIAPFPRLGLAAHIQFMVNGFLIAILGLVLYAIPNRIGKASITIMVISIVLTWLMLVSEVGNAWWGTNQTLNIAASQAGATGGKAWQELFVKVTHIVASFGLIASWVLLLLGLRKGKE